MYRFSIIAGAATLFLLTTVGSSPQNGVGSLSYIRRQANTPGTPETGHANISGTMKAGQIMGGGAGLTSVNADLLDGLNSTAFLQSIPVPLTLIGNHNNAIIKGENSTTVGGAASINGTTTGATGSTYGGYFLNFSTSGTGVLGLSNAASGATYGVRGQSSSSSGYGVHGAAIATTGTTYGGHFESASTSGRGVYGVANAATGNTYGGRFESQSTSGFGVYGEAVSSSGSAFGVYGRSASTDGRGVNGVAGADSGPTYGVLGHSFSNAGTGVAGFTSTTVGFTYGVSGTSASTSGRGVFGSATATSGTNYGGRFESDSTSGRGVYGFATAVTGTNYGVRGQTSSATGFGVYSVGDFGASGTKSFRIDHPFDPENKYLLHYATESPFPQNFYSGNAVTDAKGYAWVELPEYFAEINANFKYQLTVLDEGDADEFIWAKVVQKVRDNRFRIRTNLPNIEVSWRVEADRNDLYARHKNPKDVIEKQGLERGKYQHPELYDMPKEMGMNYRAETPRPAGDNRRK